MKILCVIDSFGSGGAQRQMASLAIGLKKRGHEVELFNYFPRHDFFRGKIEESGIPIHDVTKAKGFSLRVLFKLGKLLNRGKYEVALSFLNTPNTYLELSRFLHRPMRRVVSERSNHVGARAFPFQRVLHRFASRVVVNSWSHRDWLESRHPWLNEKLSVIYNGVDTDLFKGSPSVRVAQNELNLLAIGRVGPEKNPLNLIKALHLFHCKWGWVPSLTWVGREDQTREGRKYGKKVEQLLDSMPVIKDKVLFPGENKAVHTLLAQHDALIHPSFYEGMPNVICEALCSSRPVLASDVSDNGRLVEEGERGFLFNPHEPETIVSAMKRLTDLSPEKWEGVSANCRRYAEENLSVDKLVSQYESLFQKLCENG